MKRIIFACFAFFAFSLAVIISFSTVLASNGLPSFQNTWTCADKDGFTEDPTYPASSYCYKEGCMSESQLLVWAISRPGESRSQYDLTFSVARPGNYSCEVKVITNEFSFSCRNLGEPDCGAYCPQTNEKTDVFLNAELVGTTDDPFCNTWDDCETGEGESEGEGEGCHEYSSDGVSGCSSHSGCCWMYGAAGNEKCGGVGLCEDKDTYMCRLRICYWDGNNCHCLKEEGDAWQGGCSQWDNDASTCNDYSAHKGVICCHDGSKCITDPCPVWYKSRTNAIYEDMINAGMTSSEALEDLGRHCEGNRPISYKTNYNVLDPGVCEWDDDWTYKSFNFPCRCASAGGKTSANTYVKR